VTKLAQLKRMKALKATVIFGLATAALYAAIFLNSGMVMKYFTKGGMYALLPVGTAFLFSFVHGAFTGNFWSALGIEALPSELRSRVPQPSADHLNLANLTGAWPEIRPGASLV
jgi:hypothetical protein